MDRNLIFSFMIGMATLFSSLFAIYSFMDVKYDNLNQEHQKVLRDRDSLQIQYFSKKNDFNDLISRFEELQSEKNKPCPELDTNDCPCITFGDCNYNKIYVKSNKPSQIEGEEFEITGQFLKKSNDTPINGDFFANSCNNLKFLIHVGYEIDPDVPTWSETQIFSEEIDEQGNFRKMFIIDQNYMESTWTDSVVVFIKIIDLPTDTIGEITQRYDIFNRDLSWPTQ